MKRLRCSCRCMAHSSRGARSSLPALFDPDDRSCPKLSWCTMLTQPTSFVSHLAGGLAMERACIRMIAAAAALCASGAAALAQDWPARPMTLVVPFAAGGSSDAIARIVAEGLRAELG